MSNFKQNAICCLGFVLVCLGQARAEDWLHAGPLFDHFPLTLDSGTRTEALGPLFYWEEKDTQRTWALPPLFCDTTDSALDSHEYEIGYPVLTYRRFGLERRWQFIQIFSFAGGQNGDEQKAKRTTIFPFYFRQRTEEPDQDYTAVFPFYGHLKHRLFRDEIFFKMFPVYSRTRKADIVTTNWGYPVYSVRRGNGLEGWKLWPFYGWERKEVTKQTNGFGDVETVPGHYNWFTMWPFVLDSTSGIGSENPTRQHAILLVYGYEHSPQRDSRSVIWPFFTHTIDRKKKYEERDMPWPIIEFAHGEGKTTRRIWPFFSRAHTEYLESDWYLWPVYKFNRFHADPADRSRMRILLFLYSNTVQKNTETGESERLAALWPLYTYKRDYNGNSRLQLFAPLEPILPNNRSIEREYSPVWSVWRAEKNAKTGATSQSLLWNLYRHEATPTSKKCSLLFGLFQYQSGTAGKRMRLFYIPVMTAKPAPAKAEAK
jgi:hypothetical protein